MNISYRLYRQTHPRPDAWLRDLHHPRRPRRRAPREQPPLRAAQHARDTAQRPAEPAVCHVRVDAGDVRRGAADAVCGGEGGAEGGERGGESAGRGG